MSDLRNFDPSNESDLGAMRMEPSVTIPSDLGDRAEPLAEYHTVDVEEGSSAGRIAGGVAVALMLGAAIVYGYEISGSSQAMKAPLTQTAENKPQAVTPPPAPVQSADASQTNQANQTSAATDSLNTPEPAAPAMAATVAPTAKKSPVRSAAMDAGSANSSSPVQQQTAAQQSVTPSAVTPSEATPQSAEAATGTPERSAAVQPVYPTAPASSMATNNTQPIAPPAIQTPEVTPPADQTQSQAASPAQQSPDQAVQPQPAPEQSLPQADQSGQPAQ